MLSRTLLGAAQLASSTMNQSTMRKLAMGFMSCTARFKRLWLVMRYASWSSVNAVGTASRRHASELSYASTAANSRSIACRCMPKFSR